MAGRTIPLRYRFTQPSLHTIDNCGRLGIESKECDQVLLTGYLDINGSPQAGGGWQIVLPAKFHYLSNSWRVRQGFKMGDIVRGRVGRITWNPKVSIT